MLFDIPLFLYNYYLLPIFSLLLFCGRYLALALFHISICFHIIALQMLLASSKVEVVMTTTETQGENTDSLAGQT